MRPLKKKLEIKKKTIFKGVYYLYITSNGIYLRKDKINKDANVKIYHIKRIRLPHWIEILFVNKKDTEFKADKEDVVNKDKRK